MSEIVDIEYIKISEAELCLSLFDSFNRYQEVTHCYRKEEDTWVLKEIAFVENWGEKEKEYLTECLKHTLMTGGSVMAAFSNGNLVGFSSVEGKLFGSEKQYAELTCIHVSYEWRGHKIGKELFRMAAHAAAESGAQKLYISAHSSEETQAFYRKMGCVEAEEYHREAVEKEPFDCQMEYDLGKGMLPDGSKNFEA